MNIGFGSISVYDAIKYNLFFDETTNSAYFEAFDHQYSIKLDNKYIEIINQNKKIWITLTRQVPRLITPNFKFDENEVTIEII